MEDFYSGMREASQWEDGADNTQAPYPPELFSQESSSNQSNVIPDQYQNYMPRTTSSTMTYQQLPAYQAAMGYQTQPFTQTYSNFQPQRPPSTTSSAFRPQANIQQAMPQAQYTANFMNNPQPRAMTPVQGQIPPLSDARMSYSYHQMMPQQQNQTFPYRYQSPTLTPGMSQSQSNGSNTNLQQQPQMHASPYFSRAGSTLDPRALQMQYSQQQSASSINPAYTQHNNMDQHQMEALRKIQQSRPQIVSDIVQQPPKTLPTKVQQAVSASARSSDSGIEEVDELPEPRPAFLAIAVPTDERQKLLYQVLESVWSPRNKNASPEKIKHGITFFGDALRGLRDRWRTENEKFKKAELQTSDTASEVTILKLNVSKFRELMETLVGRVAKFAHFSILHRLGDNDVTLSALYSFLLDRFTATDYNSKLVLEILTLAVNFKTVDEARYEKFKWLKILSRFSTKSTDEEIKKAAQTILANAKKASSRPTVEGSVGDQAAVSSAANAGTKNVNAVAGVKRSRDDVEAAQQPKRPAVKSSAPLSIQIAEQRRKAAKQKEAEAAAKKAADAKAATTAKPKTPFVPKPSPFSGLMSASKKPGTSITDRQTSSTVQKDNPAVPAAQTNGTTSTKPAVSKTAPVKSLPATAPAQIAKVAAQPQTASSFASLLSDMDKPKTTPTKKAIVIPDETPEQREKRLKKEARRTLRVSWKPEGELEQVKIFEHDIEEETGHAEGERKDVTDTRSEGEMLKLQHQHAIEEDDDSDEDDAPEYFTPSEVDFSVLEPDNDGSYIKTGGPLKPESKAAEVQERLEHNVLMATYTDTTRPDTPREPVADDDEGEFVPEGTFGEPSEPRVREREKAWLQENRIEQPRTALPSGIDLSALLAITNAQNQHSNPLANGFAQPILPPPPPLIPGADLGAVLAMLHQQGQGQLPR